MRPEIYRIDGDDQLDDRHKSRRIRRPPLCRLPLSCLESDGLFYCKIGPDRPWDKSSPEDWANIYGQGRMLRAMLAMHQLEGNDAWVDRMQRLTRTLEKIAVRKTDPESGKTFAYFPTTPGYGDIFSYPKSGWKTTELDLNVDKSKMGKLFGDFPDHSFGIPLYLGGVVEPLVRYATLHDDPEAMKLAGELVRFVMKKESGWMPDGHAQGVIPNKMRNTTVTFMATHWRFAAFWSTASPPMIKSLRTLPAPAMSIRAPSASASDGLKSTRAKQPTKRAGLRT